MIRRAKTRAEKRGSFRLPGRMTLSDAWRAWIVENAAGGASREELVQALGEAGVPRGIAVVEVKNIVESPAFGGCLRLNEKRKRLELVLRLLRTHPARASMPNEIERRDSVAADEFFEGYYAIGRPVVLTKWLKDWPALSKWTPEFFAAHFGDVEIEVVAGRDMDPDCDRHLDRHRRIMTMGAYCELVRSRGVTNDIYLVSNNRAFERPELAALLADLAPPAEMFDVPVRPGSSSLWFGPAGTRTPLHHDISNIMVCQVYGRKRITLIAPFSAGLALSAEGYYAARDWREVLAGEEDPVPVQSVVLGPGEALFLPAGYWHEVEAVEPSIHVSMLGFRRSNSVGWYGPGFVRGG